jgi:hypothetical protein
MIIFTNVFLNVTEHVYEVSQTKLLSVYLKTLYFSRLKNIINCMLLICLFK